MKKFLVTLSVVLCFCFLALTSSAQADSASHAYINLTTFQCPNGGNFNFKLEWKSAEEVPSIPEANEFSRLWPTDQESGVFCRDGQVIEINEKHQFPVDLDQLAQMSINTGAVKGEEVISPIQNREVELVFGKGGAQGILIYDVTFE